MHEWDVMTQSVWGLALICASIYGPLAEVSYVLFLLIYRTRIELVQLASTFSTRKLIIPPLIQITQAVIIFCHDI